MKPRGHHTIASGLIAGALAVISSGAGPNASAADQGDTLAIQAAANPKGGSVDVGSFAITGAMPNKYSGYGANVPPDLYWTGGPEGTKSYVVLVEDGNAHAGGGPIAHWVVFNIPEFITNLPDAGRWDTPPPGLTEGANVNGAVGYLGPKPPPGPAHHYHFEVFALDRTLPLGAGASRDVVREALKGHVLAQGEMVATYQAPGG